MSFDLWLLKFNAMRSYLQMGYRLVLCLLIVTVASCSHSFQFNPSTLVPGANGRVKVNKDKNNNYAINISVDNLADPGLLQTPKANYIVWMETTDKGTQNLGRLVPSRGLFSKSSSGSLQTVTPFAPVRFFITAEDQIDPAYPSQTILSSENSLIRERN
jgi:hypothetical protein